MKTFLSLTHYLSKPKPSSCFWLALVVLLIVPACNSSKDASKQKTSPAKVEKLPQETEIALITLTAEAEQRLGITLQKVTREEVQRRRTFGGEVMIPGGKSIIVSAPVAGMIAPPEQSPIPLPGVRVEAGSPVLSLIPLLTPERYVPTPAERVQITNARATLLSALTVAKGDVQRSTAEVEAAKITLDRAKNLLEDKVGSERSVDDAQAVLNIATPTLAAAKDREQQFEKLLAELDTDSSDGKASPLNMTSPQSGVIRTLSVSRGQTVGAGAALFEVVDTSTMWVRVPLYVDLIPEVELKSQATLVALGQRSNFDEDENSATNQPRRFEAQPVVAPPSADPLSTTADLFYEVKNTGNLFRPGQRIGVELKLRGAEEGLIISAKSVLYDIYGGTWVYVKSAAHGFQRHRVLIRYTKDGQAILDEGPEPGTEVVIDGAAELFGTEFGAGK